MTTMKVRLDTERRSVAEQAAEWLLILEEGKPDDQEAFATWLTRSPLHVGAFLRASAVDSLGAEVDPERSIEIDLGPFSDVAEIGSAPAREADLPPPPSSILRRFGLKTWAIAASATFVAVALGAFFSVQPLSSDSWKHYTAAVGEQRVLELEDGSVMYLGAGSSVDVSFVEDERRLRLISGEAMFQVRHGSVGTGVLDGPGLGF